MLDRSKLSMFQQLALLPEEERDAFLADFTDEEVEKLMYDGEFMLRPGQMPPAGPWNICLFSAGRGTGKTFAGAHWVKKYALEHPGCRIALVGRTISDVHKVMITGDSGIMSVHTDDEKPQIKITKGRIEWNNGSIAEWASSESPAQIRGPQYHAAWADEHAAWLHTADDSGLNAWDNLRMAVRLGKFPKIFATTTPKRSQAIIDIFEEHEENPERVIIMSGSTFDNAANLSQGYIDSIVGKYGLDSNIGRQELLGELLGADSDGLWTQPMIDDNRWHGEDVDRLRHQLPVRCIGLDPSISDKKGDECGIVVAGATGQRELHRRHAYVLEDATLQGSPEEWAQKAVDLAHKYRCPIVAEGNQGRALVRSVIHNIDPGVQVFLVNASQGKFSRAEPVVVPYTQGRVHHVDYFDELEMQMTSFSKEGSKKSPDRMDAAVWALTACLIEPPQGFGSGPMRTSRAFKNARIDTAGRGSGRTWRHGMDR